MEFLVKGNKAHAFCYFLKTSYNVSKRLKKASTYVKKEKTFSLFKFKLKKIKNLNVQLTLEQHGH